MTAFSVTQEVDNDENTPGVEQKLDRMFRENYIRLGGSNIDVHLEDEDYQTSWKIAVRAYQTYSQRSTWLAYGPLALSPQQQEYVLNERIDNVIQVWRSRGLFGGASGGSGAFESFGAATANTLLRGGIGQNGAAFDLFSYDLVLQYQETLDRLFVRELHFVFRNETNTIFFTQVPNQNEQVVLQCSALKSWNELLEDHWAHRWLQDYTLAEMKLILAEKYRLFATLPGAQGGSVMKGEQLAGEGLDEKRRLEDDALLFGDAGMILQPIRG
jgi:hypothetical protein